MNTTVRATNMAYELVPKVLGAEEGKINLLVTDIDKFEPKNAATVRNLAQRGYHVINIFAYPGSVGALNKRFEGRYEFVTLQDVRDSKDDLTGRIDGESEKAKETNGIFKSAQEELNALMEQAGLDTASLNLLPQPVFLKSVDPVSEEPIELTLNKDGVFEFVIRPDIVGAGIKDGKGTDFWKNRMQIEMMAAYKRKEPFPDRNTQLIHSQDVAHEIMTKTLGNGQPDVDALPEFFPHLATSEGALGRLDKQAVKEKDLERKFESWKLLEKCRSFNLSLDEFGVALDALETADPYYKSRIQLLITQRVIVANGEAGYYEHTYDKDRPYIFVRKKLVELETSHEVNGKKVYVAFNKLFVVNDLPENGIVKFKDENSETLFFHNEDLLVLSKYGFGKYEYPTYMDRTTINKGCITFNGSFEIAQKNVPNYLLDTFTTALSAVEITTSEQRISTGMTFEKGIVETPIPVEYGKGEWDNPVRVFQDIVQNHVDADPRNKADLKYEVLKYGPQGIRMWVAGDSMKEDDVIVGFAVMDNGGGYPPQDLGTMGKSSKKSPLFAGKYGEGQKMIAATAARNDLNLIFTSTGTYMGRTRQWIADVGTQDVEVVEGGKKTTQKGVAFDVKTIEASTHPAFTSATIIRLPDTSGPARYDDPEWKKWQEVIDPRKKDERGNGGLSRYVINLRQDNNPQVIDMGYMRILLDEPGAVYENGLLVSRDGDKTVLGYDVPEVVITRERNTYDKERLRRYIGHALMECKDPRLAKTLVEAFKQKNLKAMAEGRAIESAELDLNFGFLFDSYNATPAKPIWEQEYDRQLQGYLVTSTELMRERIANANKKEKRVSYIDPGEIDKETEEAQRVLDGIDEIPKNLIIDVGRYNYNAWKNLFPTVSDDLLRLQEMHVPTDGQTLASLREIVVQSVAVLRDAIIPPDDSDEKVTYDSVITRTDPESIKTYQVSEGSKRALEALAYWSDKSQLEAHPDSIFVAPAHAGYLGVATKDKIGFNEELITIPDDSKTVVTAARHELLHKVFNLRDYSPELITLVLQLARYNVKHRQN